MYPDDFFLPYSTYRHQKEALRGAPKPFLSLSRGHFMHIAHIALITHCLYSNNATIDLWYPALAGVIQQSVNGYVSYLRQLAEFGYLEAHGGNKNRTYRKLLYLCS